MALSQSALLEVLDALKAGESVEMIRDAVQVILQELIEAEATAVIGAERHERTESRVVQRNGHRERVLSTRTGDIGGLPVWVTSATHRTSPAWCVATSAVDLHAALEDGDERRGPAWRKLDGHGV